MAEKIVRVPLAFCMAAVRWCMENKDLCEKVTRRELATLLIEHVGPAHAVTDVSLTTVSKIANESGVKLMKIGSSHKMDRTRALASALQALYVKLGEEVPDSLSRILQK